VSLVRERQRWPVGGGFSGFNDNRGISGWVEAGIGAGPGDLTVRALGQDYHHLYRSARGSAPIAGTDDLQKEQLWEGALGYRLAVGAHEIDIGLEGATRSIESPDKLLEDKASDSQLELFGQDAWGLGRTTVTAGARLTVNDRWGNTASPTVGFSSLLGEAIRVFGTVGRGFRAPSFKELAWDFANVGAGYTVQGFAELGPERSWSASGGLEWAPGSSVLITGEAYHNEIDDLIEFAFVGNTPSGLLVYSPRNVERARTRGLELTAEARLGAARVSGDYAFLDAKSLDDGLPLDRRARHSGRVRIAGEVPLLEGTQVDLTAHVTGDAPLVGLDDEGQPATIGTQEALMALDAQIAIRVPGDLRLVLGADNLLDSRPTGWQAVVGRRFRVGIEARNLF
jgi:outer membrane receptor for ferrienterochelin and colicins